MDFASCHILRKIQTKLTSQDTTAVIKYQCKVDMKHQTTDNTDIAKYHCFNKISVYGRCETSNKTFIL